MGRPRDQFAWKQVEVVRDNTWRCKYCSEEYSGAASRIRNHLSGQGNGIAPCKDAPDPIKNEASKKVSPNKRARLTDSSPSSSNDPEIIAKRALEEHVADAFLKLLYCNNVSSVTNDVVKDPSYTEFVERASKYGFLSSLLWGDSFFIEKSVFNIKQEVKRYMHDVKESWKRTGCTVISFNLQSHKTNGKLFATLEKDMFVTAYYCPKGIFFVEGMDLKYLYEDDEMQNGYVHFLFHSYNLEYLCEDDLCELTDTITSATMTSDTITSEGYCAQNKILHCCNISRHKSKWAKSLINIAVQIHEHLCSCHELQSWYYKILRREHLSFKVLPNNHDRHARCLSIFLSIQSIGFDELRSLSTQSCIHLKAWDAIKAITNGTQFWIEGNKLALILKGAMKIGDVMDTFVPTAGYYGMALDKVDHTIMQYGGLTEDASEFWKELKSDIFDDHTDGFVASCLNPVYFLSQLEKDSELPVERIKAALEEWEFEACDEEVERYADVFRNLPEDYKLEDHHPVKVWETHGHSLPNLQRFAIILLNQPLSCMCKQVKKHSYQLEGAEDYILRLNVRMMQHFKLSGDDIYKPLDLSALD